MKIAGFSSGHDVAYCVLNNGIPEIHNELERFNRVKDTQGDSIDFFFKNYKDYKEVKYFTHCIGSKRDNDQYYKKSFDKCRSLGTWVDTGHHQSHAANAFYSSDFKESLIITIDAGGVDRINKPIHTCFTVWEGKDNKIKELEIWPSSNFHMGGVWSACTVNIFGLSATSPSQQGTVMGMAALGDPNKYLSHFLPNVFQNQNKLPSNYQYLSKLVKQSEQAKFDVAASLQKITEITMNDILNDLIKKYNPKNLCFSGGCALNCVLLGKIYDWYPKINIFCDPVPYDAGLALGSARYVWHDILDKPRIYNTPQNRTSYLGKTYSIEDVNNALKKYNINKNETLK